MASTPVHPPSQKGGLLPNTLTAWILHLIGNNAESAPPVTPTSQRPPPVVDNVFRANNTRTSATEIWPTPAPASPFNGMNIVRALEIAGRERPSG
jgi:hypothetical protein